MRKKIGARFLQRLGNQCALTLASSLRSQPPAQDAKTRLGVFPAICQRLALQRKPARSANTDRVQSKEFGMTHCLEPLPPAWWLQCSHRRQALGPAGSLARPNSSRSSHSVAQKTVSCDAAAGARQTSCAGMQQQPSSASHAVQPPGAPMNPGWQRRRSSMAATAVQMAPPAKWANASRPPPPSQHGQASGQWMQDPSTASQGSAPLPAASQGRAPLPAVNGSIVDATALRRRVPADAAAAVAAQPATAAAEYSGIVEGSVRHVTFRAPDTGFTVLKVDASLQEGAPAGSATQRSKPAGGRGRKQSAAAAGLVTVCGNFEPLNKGQRLRFEGRWVEHSTFGSQLQAARCVDLEPGSLNSLKAYLGSGAIRGIGPKMAQYMVDGLGENVLEVLDDQFAVDALMRCKKIGRVMAEKIKEGWEESRSTRNIVIFLQESGLTAVQAQRIVNQHGVETQSIIMADPYRAMLGGAISFNVADALAFQLGALPELAGRGAAAMLHELASSTRRNGHTYLTWSELQSAVLSMLEQTGRPWRDASKLLAEAQRMHTAGELFAESAHEEPRVHEAWLSSAARSAGGSAASAWAGGGSAAQSLEEHMLAHMNGLGPKTFQMIIQRVGAASLPALLDRSDAREELQKVPGIGPFKSEKIKVSWDRSRHLLPEAALEPPPPPQQQPEAAASAAAAEIVWDAGTRCYAPAMFRAEATVASVLSRLAAQPVLEPPRTGSLSGSERVERWITNNEKSTNVKLSAGQREAIRLSSSAPIMVLTGGPGCGKTFATATIVKLWRAMRMTKTRRSSQSYDVRLCAPTGRASQRLEAVTGVKSTTIHRLLGVRGRKDSSGPASAEAGGEAEEGEEALEGGFEFCAGRPLDCDALLVDESSMLDLPLAAALLDALPRHRRVQLVLVGDADQLPPVGPGGVLEAAIASAMIPVIDLRQIFRQAQESAIVTSAHAVNSGRFPDLQPVPPHLLKEGGEGAGESLQQLVGSDAVWVRVEDWAGAQAVEDQVLAAVEHLLAPRIDVINDLQVMTPMKKGPAGTRSLNRRLQALLNSASADKPELPRRAWSLEERGGVFRLGDRVIQVVNDYEKDVFNGDQGFVSRVTAGSSPSMEVTYPPSSTASAPAGSPAAPERVIQYSNREMDVLDLAWATTVHKAQGGEAKAVLLALSPTHRPLLSRRLLYTGLTRAKELLVVVGTQGAISSAVKETGASARKHCVERRFVNAAMEAGVQKSGPKCFEGPVEPSVGAVEHGQQPLDAESIRAAYA